MAIRWIFLHIWRIDAWEIRLIFEHDVNISEVSLSLIYHIGFGGICLSSTHSRAFEEVLLGLIVYD